MKEILTVLGFTICILSVICMARACMTMKQMIANDGYGWKEPEEVENEYAFSMEDLRLIARLVEAEAGNQSKLGKQAVAWVVFCRWMHDKGHRSVEGIIYQKGQFTLPKKEYSDHTWQAVLDIFRIHDGIIHGEDLFPDDLYYFRTGKYHKYGIPYEKIGDHYFSILGE